jgi:hypothetical protein
MKRARNLFAGICFGALVLASASVTFGQQKPAPDGPVVNQSEKVMVTTQGPDLSTSNFVFVASEMNFEGKLVKGAPYSAEAVTEITQTLSDGNRIVNKSTASVYRDSEGRTRREQTLRAIGPFANEGEPPQAISINDPVAGVSYSLEPRTHVARKMAPMRFEFKVMADAPPSGGEKPAVAPDGPAPPARAKRIEIESGGFSTVPAETGAAIVWDWHGTREGNAKTESLGKQNIEGVEAEGTRTTMTIPAGEIGNERAIEIVSERWYSPELQVVVMTRHSDPRNGETVYRLTNINRSEPAKSLFEVPSDYTVKEGPRAPQPMRVRRPMDEQ